MRRAAAALIALATVLTVGGCATEPPRASTALQAVIADRDLAVLEAHAGVVDRVSTFLRNKWGPVTLPEEDIVGFVSSTEWGPALAGCISDLGFPGVVPADGGERLDFSGVRIDNAREGFEIDVATYRCQARYPVRGWFDEQVRQVEVPWALDYIRQVQIPCLLAEGHEVPPLPRDDVFGEEWRTADAWDAFALTGADPLVRTRAELQCPGPLSLLDDALRGES